MDVNDSANWSISTRRPHTTPDGPTADGVTTPTYCPTQHACVGALAAQTPTHSASHEDAHGDSTTRGGHSTDSAGQLPLGADAAHSRQLRVGYDSPAPYHLKVGIHRMDDLGPSADSPPPGRAADVIESMYSAPEPMVASPADQQHTYQRWPHPASNMDPAAGALYAAALTAVAAGAHPPRIDHTTSLHTAAWEAEATGHPDDAMVLHGIKHCFATQYSGPPMMSPPATYNHQSAVNFAEHIDAYVERELAEGALSGPYQLPPFNPWFISSPIMSREKSGGEGRRVIVDLSFPDGGINQFIAPHVFDGRDAVHNLPTIQSAIATLASTPPGDIQLAYRQFPVTPLDWPLLGIHWRGCWSFDCRIPFGCRMSSYVMQTIAEFIVRALAKRAIKAHIVPLEVY